MMNRLEVKSLVLLFENKKLEPASPDSNTVGFCTKCNSELRSLAYHKHELNWLVSATCKNEHPVLILYDAKWNWLCDQELEVFEDMSNVSAIPREKLETIFTPAEIRDMLALECGKSYTRQNIYRSRAKVEKFEKLFDIRIRI
jgi:hypothetical protein